MLNLDTSTEQLQALYVGYFGRGADPDGLAYWEGRYASGEMSIKDIAASFSVQQESVELHHPYWLGGGGNASEFVSDVYEHLFNRYPDAEGHAYWVNELNNSKDPIDVGSFVLKVMNGAQGNDAAIIQNKVDAAIHFTTQVDAHNVDLTHIVDGHTELTPEALRAAIDVVDNEVTHDPNTIQESHQETAEFIESQPHTHEVGLVGISDHTIDLAHIS